MKTITRALEWVVIAMMATVALMIISEVVSRTLFSTSLVVSEELSRYLMIWTAMLAVALVAGEDGHIRITMVSDALNAKGRFFLGLCADAVVIAFLAVLVVTSVLQLPRMGRQGTVTLGVDMDVIYAAMPVGGALTILFVLARMTRRVSEFRRPPSSERESF